MGTKSLWRNGALMFYDTYRHRALDAIGGDLQKFILDTTHLPVDDTTGDPDGMTLTAVEAGAGDSTAVLADGKLLLTTAANENDGVSLQLKGEAFLLSSAWVYFGIKLQINDVDQTDLLAGLCITDTALLGGMTDGAYFESVDGSASVNFVLEKNSTETTSASAIGTLADDTDITLEFVFDGTYVDTWVDGVLQTRLAVTNLPNDEQLTPSLEFLTGETTANTCSVDWWRVIQIPE